MPERRFNLKLLTEIDIPARLFKAGETIFHKGEEGNELFIIRSGGVRISVDGRTLDELRENDLFGEMALVDNSPRAAMPISLTASQIFRS
jgi:CRP/FNR family transcriptional regulator, cyclic AMP receptor protein